MFDISWGEFLLIGIVALIVIGPKELPRVLRTVGQWMTKLRRMASEFQGQFQEAIREAEMADLKKEVDEMTAKATSYAHFDPIGDIRKEIESTVNPQPAVSAPAEQAASMPAEPASDTAPEAPTSSAVEQSPAEPAPSTPAVPEPAPADAAPSADDWPRPASFRDPLPEAGGKSA